MREPYAQRGPFICSARANPADTHAPRPARDCRRVPATLVFRWSMSDPWEIPDVLLDDPAYWRGLAAAVLEEAASSKDNAEREILHAMATNLERGAEDAERRLRERQKRASGTAGPPAR
jgi:hypothetical protein